MSLDNYTEETQPLFKMLRTEAFRFIIVRYNHYSFVQQLEQDVQAQFPDRPFLKIDAKTADYNSITQQYFSIARGFLFLVHFEDVLQEQYNDRKQGTPEYQQENERRRGISAGLNLRRDKLAKQPVALFVFIQASSDDLYAKTIMEKMPDLWSFRSMILDLEKTGVGLVEDAAMFYEVDELNHLKFNTDITKDRREYERLKAILEQIPLDEIDYRLTLFPQITEAAIKIGAHQEALQLLEEWEAIAPEESEGFIWSMIGIRLKDMGDLDRAKSYFTKSILDSENDPHFKAALLSLLADIHKSEDNLSSALSLCLQAIKILENLISKEPDTQNAAQLLYFQYEKVGELLKLNNRPEDSLRYFELALKQLDKSPTGINLKAEESTILLHMSSVFFTLGNIEKSINMLKASIMLRSWFLALNPIFNVEELKNGLAIENYKLGYIYKVETDIAQAKQYYEQALALWKDIDQPQIKAFSARVQAELEGLGAS